MPVTIYDVAKKAGVGVGTVSRAINNSPLIHPNTKERILQVIRELNYQPHALAQSLARKKTFTIASVVPFFTNYFFVELLRSVQLALARNNYDLILYNIHRMDRRDSTLDRVLHQRRTDGVLIFSLQVGDHYAERFIQSNIPVVIVDHMHPKIDSIVIANQKGAYVATRHLIALGHREIGMINGHLSSYPAMLRLKGFQQALQESGLSFDDRHVVICDATSGEHGFNEAAGYAAMKRLIAQNHQLPTALFVASDVQALGVMRAAKEAGIRIPEDMAIVGFDDIELAKFVGLTTMRQPIVQMGEMAVDHLLAIVNGKSMNGLYTELEAELIVRESCGSKKAFCVQVE